MFDYLAWLNRAEMFMRSLGHLPDIVSLRIDRQPPLAADRRKALAQEVEGGIPESLLDFYSTAAAGCEMHFSWQPSERFLASLNSVIEHTYNLYAGPSFISPQELADSPWPLSDCGECFRESGETDDEQLISAYTNGLGFIGIGNGDWIAFDGRVKTPEPPIIYLSHEEPTVYRLSPNFDSFLRDWEHLCYIGAWQILDWVDNEQGTLMVQSPQATHLRQLLIR